MLADKRVRLPLAEVSAGPTDQGRPALTELPGLYQPAARRFSSKAAPARLHRSSAVEWCRSGSQHPGGGG